MRTFGIMLALGLSAACSRPQAQLPSQSTAFDPSASAYASGPASDAAAAAADAPASAELLTRVSTGEDPAPVRVGQAAPPDARPMLAYSFSYGIEAPPAKVRPLMSEHERACVQAGRTACQVIGSNVGSRGRDMVSARLELRASPAWIARFKAGLAAQTEKAGGRITQDSTVSEDLTRSIIDTEATLRAKTALRDRLQILLQNHPGKLSDLLDVERELTRVQTEIDSTQSELSVMRARVATSALAIAYESEGVLAPQGVMTPLKKALVDDFLGIVIVTLAAMVRLLAWLLPWIAIGAVLAWVFRGRLKKVRWPRPKPTAAEPPPPA